MKSSKNKKLLAFFLAALGLSVNSLNVSAENKQISAENEQMQMRENIKSFFDIRCQKYRESNALDKLASEIRYFLNYEQDGKVQYKDNKIINYSYIFNTLLETLKEISQYREDQKYNSKLYDRLNDENNNIFSSFPGNLIDDKSFGSWLAWIHKVNSVRGGYFTAFNRNIRSALKALEKKMCKENKENKENKEDNKIIKAWYAAAYTYNNTISTANSVKCYLDKDGHLSLELSEGVNKIGNVCNNLPEDNKENTVKLIKSITIPKSVKFIGSFAFSKFENLEEIKIPNSVTSIGRHAFGGCTELKEITIPNSVEKIDQLAFGSQSHLEKVKIAKDHPKNKEIKEIFNSQRFYNVQIEEIEKI